MSTSTGPPPPPATPPPAPPSARLELARAVAAAAAGVTGVASLSPGPGVPPVVTLGGADSVTGVRLTSERVEVHVVANRFPLPEVIAAVTEAVVAVLRARGDGRDAFVRVEDVTLGDSLAGDTEAG